MLNKTVNIYSSASKTNKDKRNRFGSILHWFNIISISFLVIWVVMGNLVAYQLEQPVLIARNDLVHQFPKIETNASGLKLKELKAKLIGSLKMSPNLRDDLSRHIGDSTTVLSDSLQQYLLSQSENMAALRTQALQSGIPRWEKFDLDALISLGAFEEEPSVLIETDFQRILIADAIKNYRIGKYQIASDSLEAAWRLNQSIRERPTLISQLVSIIIDGIQLQGLRKIDRVSPDWQMRMISQDSKKQLLNSLKFEAFRIYGRIRNFPLRKGGSQRDEQSASILSRILQPFLQPFFTLSAVDTWQVTMRDLELRFNQDPCIPVSYEDMPQLSSWNILGTLASSPSYQIYKLTKRQIDMELTQKILRLREVASQTGKFPQTLSEIDSSVVCKNLRYVYQPAPDGKMMTISVSPQNRPEWLVEREGDIPLSYTTKLQNL